MIKQISLYTVEYFIFKTVTIYIEDITRRREDMTFIFEW
jgi:hypothetical protein